MFRCGLWASSGPFPLSAHYGLYKRRRDPPTNPSRYLKKERSILPLKWLLKEDQGSRPTAASAAATAAALPRAAAVPTAETAASPCPDHVLPRATSLRRRRCRRHRPPLLPPPSDRCTAILPPPRTSPPTSSTYMPSTFVIPTLHCRPSLSRELTLALSPSLASFPSLLQNVPPPSRSPSSPLTIVCSALLPYLPDAGIILLLAT